MKERGILFSGPMVLELLADRKRQTRRIVKAQHGWDPHELPLQTVAQHPDLERAQAFFGHWRGVGCPYGKVGDRLWVRETWAWPGEEDVIYRADQWTADMVACWKTDPNYPQVRWKPAIHMPRKRSRILLDITGIRIERVQDISDADADAEGVRGWAKSDAGLAFFRGIGIAIPDRPSFLFRLLWTHINGAESWEANPWVWVVEFKPVEVRR